MNILLHVVIESSVGTDVLLQANVVGVVRTVLTVVVFVLFTDEGVSRVLRNPPFLSC